MTEERGMIAALFQLKDHCPPERGKKA